MSKLMEFLKGAFSPTGGSSRLRGGLILLTVGGIIAAGTWLFTSASGSDLISLTDRPLSGPEVSRVSECLSRWARTYQIRDSYILVKPAERSELLAVMDFLSDSSPKQGTDYNSLVGSSGIFLSEVERQRRWKLGREADLAAQIGAFRGIRSARVFLSSSSQTGFGSTAAQPTASVTLWTNNDKPVSLPLAQAIRCTVAGSIADLDPQNVHIVDAVGGVYIPFIPPGAELDNRASAEYIAALRPQAEELAAELEDKLHRHLSYIPGVIITVTVDPRSLLPGAAGDRIDTGNAEHPPAPLASIESKPDINVLINIPRTYLLSISNIDDPEQETHITEETGRIIAAAKAVTGRPASTNVHLDIYQDRGFTVSTVTQAEHSANTVKVPPKRWRKIVYACAGLGCVGLLAVGGVALQRRYSSGRGRTRGIAISRVRSQQHYLSQMPRPKKRSEPQAAAELVPGSQQEELPSSPFEKLTELEDAGLRILLMRTEPGITALALRTASEKLRRRILRVLPADRLQALQDHPDFSAPARLSDIEAAQLEMLDLLDVPESVGAEPVGSSAV